MTQTFLFAPSPDGTSEDITNKARTAQFGDGYSQRVLDGINTRKRVWTVNFALPKARMEAIDAFLNARQGVESFYWTPPYGAIGKWLCTTWKRTPVGNLEYSLSGSFVEVFGD